MAEILEVPLAVVLSHLRIRLNSSVRAIERDTTHNAPL